MVIRILNAEFNKVKKTLTTKLRHTQLTGDDTEY